MIKERYMVWSITRGTEHSTSDLESDVRGFLDLKRALAWAQKFSDKTGLSTCVEWQQYQISRQGYEVLESDFGPWGTSPEVTA